MHLVLAKEMPSAISFDFASRDFGVLSDSEPKSKPKKNKMQLESSRFFPAASTGAGSAGTHESVATPQRHSGRLFQSPLPVRFAQIPGSRLIPSVSGRND